MTPACPTILRLSRAHITRTPIPMRDFLAMMDERIAAGLDPFAPIAGGASFSDYLEGKVLEHITGKAELAKPTFYLALCTAAPTDASTGATIVEATYTGYKRKKVEAASWGAASGGAIKNSAKLEFEPCTAGSSVIKGFAGCDSETKEAGNVLCWGTVTETTISTTQTPATVAISGLEITLD